MKNSVIYRMMRVLVNNKLHIQIWSFKITMELKYSYHLVMS